MKAALHPHVGTMIESGDDVQRVLQGSSVSLCLDTGKVRSGRLTYTEAVAQGMYRPLGTGGRGRRRHPEIVASNKYDGWFVLEPDTILTEARRGEGPVTDVRASADHVRSLLAGS